MPNAHLAEIDPMKLHGYLLSASHPVGRFKARFSTALGYTADDWQVLEADLRIQLLGQDAKPGPSVSTGQTYTIQAILIGPNASPLTCSACGSFAQ